MDITKTRLGNYDVTWGTWSLGALDEVDPDIAIKTKPIKVGSVGDVVLGKRIISVEGAVKVACREISVSQFQKAMPWYTSGSTPLIPATSHKDLYDYAQLLTLHPLDSVSGTGEDVNLLKAVPTLKFMKRDGEKDDVLLVTFEFFPDRAQLPILSYGYLGSVPV